MGTHEGNVLTNLIRGEKKKKKREVAPLAFKKGFAAKT